MNYASCELTINGRFLVKVTAVDSKYGLLKTQIGSARLLGVRLKRRRAFKAAAKRARRSVRRELVHEAGCVVCSGCRDLQFYRELVHDAVALGVRIPRSLRGMR